MNKLCIKDISILNKNSEKITGLKLENKDYKFILYSSEDEISDEILNESQQFLQFSFKEPFNITSKKKMKDLNFDIIQDNDLYVLKFNQKSVFYIKDNKPTLTHQYFKIIQKNGELYNFFNTKNNEEIINQNNKVHNLLNKKNNLINSILNKKTTEINLNDDDNDHTKNGLLPSILSNENDLKCEEYETPSKEANAHTEESNAPVEEANAPAEEANAHAEEANAPVEESNAPAEELEAPSEESNLIVEEENALVEESNAIVEEHEVLAEESNAIVEELESPSEESNAHTEELKTPVEEHEALAEEPETPIDEQEIKKEIKIIEFKEIESEKKNIKKTRNPRKKKIKKEENNEMSSFITQINNEENTLKETVNEDKNILNKETSVNEQNESNINLLLNKNENLTKNLDMSNILNDFNNYIIDKSKIKTIPQQNYIFKTKNIEFFNKKYIIKPHKLQSSNINIYNLNKIKILKENILDNYKKSFLLDEINSSYLIEFYNLKYLINKINHQLILTNLKNKKTIILNNNSFFKLINFNYYITNNCTTIIPIYTKKIYDNSNGMMINYFEPIIT